jgi:hypothetical protein
MLTATRLRHLLDFDPSMGVFRWRTPTSTKMKPGDPAGCLSQGYRVIRVEGRMYKASRLAWLYMTGDWPAQLIDHIDCDKANDRWENLREADKSGNGCNRVAQKNNTSGFKGVSKYAYGPGWVAHICRNQRQKHLGVFSTKEEAFAAYKAAVSDWHGEFGRAETRLIAT